MTPLTIPPAAVRAKGPAAPRARRPAGPRTAAADPLRAAGLWPALWLAAGSPFFWAPPLWILALMSPRPHRRDGGGAGGA